MSSLASSGQPRGSVYNPFSSKPTGAWGCAMFQAFNEGPLTREVLGDRMVGQGMSYFDDYAYRHHGPDSYVRGFELLGSGGDGSAGRRDVVCFVLGGMRERKEGAGLSSSCSDVLFLSEGPESSAQPLATGSVLSGRQNRFAEVDFERDQGGADDGTVTDGSVDARPPSLGWLTITANGESDLPKGRLRASDLGVPHKMIKAPPSVFDQKHSTHMSNPDRSQGLSRTGIHYAFPVGPEFQSCLGMPSQHFWGVQPVVPRPATTSGGVVSEVEGKVEG